MSEQAPSGKQPRGIQPAPPEPGIGLRIQMGLIGAVVGSALTFGLGWLVITILEWLYPYERGDVLWGMLFYFLAGFVSLFWPVGGVLGAAFGVQYVAPRMTPSTKK